MADHASRLKYARSLFPTLELFDRALRAAQARDLDEGLKNLREALQSIVGVSSENFEELGDKLLRRYGDNDYTQDIKSTLITLGDLVREQSLTHTQLECAINLVRRRLEELDLLD